MKKLILSLSLFLAVPAFAAEMTYKKVWKGIKDDGKAPEEIEVDQRWMLSVGSHPDGEILTKFGESTFVGKSYTFVVEQEDSGLVVYWIGKASKQEAKGPIVTTTSPGSSKLKKGENVLPLDGDLTVTISVK
jgi:hypothetical protein